jgi:filamentous hemagglutinin
MHTAGGALIAGLGGGSALGGAAGAGVASALAGKLNQMADSFETNGGAGTDPGLTAGNIAVNLIAGGIGGLVGGNSGAVTASNADLYNRNSTNAEGNGGTGSEFIDRTKSADAGAWNGLVSIAEMGVNLPNGGPFASPGDTGYISLDSARLPYTAGDQIGPDVAFWTAVLATRGVGKGAAAEAEAGAIQFGKVDNQISHTFRHIEAAGFDREVVQTAIQSDLSGIASSLPQGQYTGSIVVNGVKLDDSAFKLPDGTINVGRITPPRTK